MACEMHVDPVVARSPVALDLEAQLKSCLPVLAAGRPVVIDFYTSRHGGFVAGGLTAGFAKGDLAPRYVEVEPLEGVPVWVDKRLVSLIAGGATLRLAGWPFARHLDIRLAHPEAWIEFLERHPGR